jgi:4-hydroxyphenylacetate 3-monooxygenase
MIRAQTKLEFAWGLAFRTAEAINNSAPQTHQMPGEISMFAEFVRATIFAAEQSAYEHGNGLWCLDVRLLIALRRPAGLISSN